MVVSADVIDAVQRALEQDGFLQNIRAQIRSNVARVIKQTDSSQRCIPPDVKFIHSQLGRDLLVLVRELLQKLHLKESLVVLDAEAGLEPIHPSEYERLRSHLNFEVHETHSLLEQLMVCREEDLEAKRFPPEHAHKYDSAKTKALSPLHHHKSADAKLNEEKQSRVVKELPVVTSSFPSLVPQSQQRSPEPSSPLSPQSPLTPPVVKPSAIPAAEEKKAESSFEDDVDNLDDDVDNLDDVEEEIEELEEIADDEGIDQLGSDRSASPKQQLPSSSSGTALLSAAEKKSQSLIDKVESSEKAYSQQKETPRVSAGLPPLKGVTGPLPDLKVAPRLPFKLDEILPATAKDEKKSEREQGPEINSDEEDDNVGEFSQLNDDLSDEEDQVDNLEASYISDTKESKALPSSQAKQVHVSLSATGSEANASAAVATNRANVSKFEGSVTRSSKGWNVITSNDEDFSRDDFEDDEFEVDQLDEPEPPRRDASGRPNPRRTSPPPGKPASSRANDSLNRSNEMETSQLSVMEDMYSPEESRGDAKDDSGLHSSFRSNQDEEEEGGDANDVVDIDQLGDSDEEDAVDNLAQKAPLAAVSSAKPSSPGKMFTKKLSQQDEPEDDYGDDFEGDDNEESVEEEIPSIVEDEEDVISIGANSESDDDWGKAQSNKKPAAQPQSSMFRQRSGPLPTVKTSVTSSRHNFDALNDYDDEDDDLDQLGEDEPVKQKVVEGKQVASQRYGGLPEGSEDVSVASDNLSIGPENSDVETFNMDD